MPIRWLTNRRLTWALVGLGLALRLYHYARGRAVWHDEAALVLNALDKGFLELLGPLRFSEAAPPLFLWLTRAASLALGDGPLALRLLPFLASCASLLLLASSARRLLPERAVPWAVLLFAVSEQLLWHASEAKPYAMDVLCATALIALYARVRPEAVGRWCLLFAALAPLMIWTSYPACFLLGGLVLALLPAVWRQRSIEAGLCFGLLGVSISGAFLALLLGPIHAQHDPVIHECWQNSFPDWSRPWSVPGWAFLSTLGACRYCCKPVGEAFAFLAALGAVGLWRGGRRGWTVLLLGPSALALLAACLHRYPYTGARVMVFAAPAVVLLTAAGADRAFAWLATRRRAACAVLAALLLWPMAHALRTAVFVWPETDSAGAADYVQGRRQPGEPVRGNNWSHEYYFRHLGPEFALQGEGPVPAGDRMWVVFASEGHDHGQRLALARQMAPPGWRLAEQRELSFTSVGLFERAGEEQARR